MARSFFRIDHAEGNEVFLGNGPARGPWDPDRQPRVQWLGSSVVSHWQGNGIGMADTMLFDDHGAVGRAVQRLLLRKVG